MIIDPGPRKSNAAEIVESLFIIFILVTLFMERAWGFFILIGGGLIFVLLMWYKREVLPNNRKGS